MDSFIARQPVLNARRDLFGYELLFRTSLENVFDAADGGQASSRLMTDVLTVHGLDALTNGHKAFVNVTRRVLVEQQYALLPPGRIVIEVLETIEPDEEVIAACKKVRESGYLLALDDYTFDPRFDPLLPHVDLLKVDYLKTNAEQRRGLSKLVQRHSCRLLAEKVETPQQFREASSLGFEFFQGFFFCMPEVIRRRSLDAQQRTYLQLLQQLHQPQIDVDELERILKHDPALSFKLLKYLNSASFALRHRISSLRQAVTLLGPAMLRRWASLLVMSCLGEGKPHELLVTSLARAHLCESLADLAGLRARQHDLFLLGMVSIMDAMMDQPIADVLADMPLAPEIAQTLTGKKTVLSDVLGVVTALERGRWNELATITGRWQSPAEEMIMKSYREALAFAGQAPRSHAVAA
jgi:EAL and modified HD-GYP domain-containing signal transduction protein